MQNNNLLKITSIFFIISLTSLGLVLNKMEPCYNYSASTFCQTSSSLSLTLFYLSLFFTLTSLLTLIGYISRIYLKNNEIQAQHFNNSLRQAILLALAIIASIVLLKLHILKWFLTLIIFGTILFIELYFFKTTP